MTIFDRLNILGITIEQAEKDLGVSLKNIRVGRTALRYVGAETLIRIADYLGTTAEELIEEEQPVDKEPVNLSKLFADEALPEPTEEQQREFARLRMLVADTPMFPPHVYNTLVLYMTVPATRVPKGISLIGYLRKWGYNRPLVHLGGEEWVEALSEMSEREFLEMLFWTYDRLAIMALIGARKYVY